MDRGRLRRIAQELLEIAGDAGSPEGSAEPDVVDLPAPACEAPPGALLEMAKFIRAQRKLRYKYFKKSLFGEPAWGMMLELFIAEHAGKDISTTSLCLASDVPPTTAHRYVAILMDSGLIVRQPHAKDQRQAVVRLSASGHTAICEYLTACTGLAMPRVEAPVAMTEGRTEARAELTAH